MLIRSTIARGCGLTVRDIVCPLYTVGNANHPNAMTIGEGEADITIGDVLAADHVLKVVPDDAIPVDVLVGLLQTTCQLLQTRRRDHVRIEQLR